MNISEYLPFADDFGKIPAVIHDFNKPVENDETEQVCRNLEYYRLQNGKIRTVERHHYPQDKSLLGLVDQVDQQSSRSECPEYV